MNQHVFHKLVLYVISFNYWIISIMSNMNKTFKKNTENPTSIVDKIKVAFVVKDIMNFIGAITGNDIRHENSSQNASG
jgi:hypothetical protein